MTKTASHRCSTIWTIILFACLIAIATTSALATTWDPAAPNYTGNKGQILYVSKLGDNSDGTSWTKAFHTIQAAMQAVPDDKGGHRVIIRPDTYAEANLYPTFPGAAGSYNLLVGDYDGSLGSGVTGWVIVDSGAPKVIVRTNPKAPTGNPTFMVLGPDDDEKEVGLKSVDWWGPWRCEPDFSGAIWDRWIYRRIYSTGSEGGIGWDISSKQGAPFSALVEDCVGIGRFSGAAVMAHTPRQDEPVTFRRSFFQNLDWWGDAGAAYVRGESPTMPDCPHAVFEDCTLVSPDNALQAGYPGVDKLNTKVVFKNCRLIVLNFSQPHGTPSSGIICCGCEDGKQLHVDFEDCTLMGYKVFGTRKGKVSYTTKGRVAAYVQYRQSVPEHFERLRFWPVDVFQKAGPPPIPGPQAPSPTRPKLTKLPVNFDASMENTPVIYKDQTLLIQNERPPKGGTADSIFLYIEDIATGKQIAKFGQLHSFASAYVNADELNVFASRYTAEDWAQDIYRFTTTDLKNFKRDLAIPREGDEHLFNCSVCKDDHQYTMAYESNKPVQFCFKFARSKDLATWTKIDGLVFTGEHNEYSACPVLRYIPPYYYVIYLHDRMAGHNGYTSFMARSKDLETWQLTPFNPILEATTGEGCNNSDVDIFEWQGNTYLYYATGDQATWGSVRVAMFPGNLEKFYEAWFPKNTTFKTCSAKHTD